MAVILLCRVVLSTLEHTYQSAMMANLKIALITFILVAFGYRAESGISFQGSHDHPQLAIEPPAKPVRISIGAQLIKVFTIEAPSSEEPKLQAQFKLQMQWRDERLAAWNEDNLDVHDYQDDDAASQLKKMFNPGIEIVSGTYEADHLHLRIFRHGAVSLSQVVNVTIPANMILTHFPFDKQIFAFRFASSYWDEEYLDLSLNSFESGMEEDAAPKTWHFGYNSYYVSKTRLGAHAEDFAVFNFYIHARRDPQYFIWRLILPLLVMVVLSWNVFWMFEDSSSAFSNCIVFLLTVVAFHQIANSMLPVIPYFTFLDSIVFISYGFIIIPTFQVMISSKLEFYGQSKQAAEIRRYCRFVVPIAFILCMLAIVLIYFARTMTGDPQ